MRLSRSLIATFVACTSIVGSTACATPDTVTSPLLDPGSFIETLDVREKAITLSLEGLDTLRLHVTALFADGSLVTDPIQFTTNDSTVTVDSTGLITARFATIGGLATVRVSVSHSGFTRKDSVQVRVLEHAPTVPLHTLDFRVPDGASAVIPSMTAPSSTANAMAGSLALVLQALGSSLTPVPSNEILIAVRSSDTMVAVVDQSGFVSARKPGVTVISATVFANGVFVADSLTIHVGLPLFLVYQVPSSSYSTTGFWRLSGDTARIGVGGVITFSSAGGYGVPVDLIFDNPEYAEAAVPVKGFPVTGPGNIMGFRAIPLLPDFSNLFEHLYSAQVARKFSVPGVYPFHGVMSDPTIPNDMKGVIIVCELDASECNP